MNVPTNATATATNWSFDSQPTRSQYQPRQGMDNPPTPKMYGLYTNLCQRKREMPQPMSKLTFATCQEEIDRLFKVAIVTDSQINLIKSLADEVGIPHDKIPWDKLTPGNDGLASRCIQKLQDMARDARYKAPVEGEQVQLIIKMFLCPDINTQELGIPDKLEYKIYNEETGELTHDGWRRPSAEEIASHVLANVTRGQALDFINKRGAGEGDRQTNRDLLTEWEKNRATIAQRKLIREKEARLMNELYRPKAQREAIADIFGREMVVNDEEVEYDHELSFLTETEDAKPTADNVDRWNPPSFQPIEETVLLMLSKQEADLYMAYLDADRSNPRLVKFQQEEEDSQTFEMIRFSRDQSTYNNKEFQKLNDILHALLAIRGESDFNLIDCGFYVLGESYNSGAKRISYGDNTITDSVIKKKKYIRSYMKQMIDDKVLTLSELVRMCAECDSAMEALVGF